MSQLALVTGASAGIGLRIATQLAHRGYDIVGVGASERIQSLPEKLPGVTVFPIAVDLTAPGAVDGLWARVEDVGRPLEVAVLNAGVSLGGAFIDTPVEAELRMIDLNITSQVLLAKHVAPVHGATADRAHSHHDVAVRDHADAVRVHLRPDPRFHV